MVSVDPRTVAWRSEFESLGEESVRMMDSGSQTVPDDRIRFSRVWLKEQEDSRRDAREARTSAIAEEALSIAKDANRIASEDLTVARRSARWAMYAAIIAMLAAAIATKDQIFALIFTHS